MEQGKKEKLQAKLLAILNHVDKLEYDKKEAMKGFAEQIKEGKEKIKAITESLSTDDQTFLANAYDEHEIDDLFR